MRAAENLGRFNSITQTFMTGTSIPVDGGALLV